ncbi:serine hydrolase [Patescibacteria group bacterium]
MKDKKVDLLLLLLPILAIGSLFFVFSQNPPFDLRETSFPQSEEVKNISSTRPEIEDSVYFKSVDEHLVYLRKQVSNERGTFGFFIKDLKTDEEYTFNSSEIFYGASLYKLSIAVAIFKDIELRNIKLEDKITFTSSDHTSGTGSIGRTSYGTKYTIGAVLEYLMRHSDNSGQVMLEKVLGEPKIGKTFENLTPEQNYNNFYHKNMTSPREYGYIVEKAFYGDWISETNKMRLLDLMYPTLFDDRITPYLKEGLIFYHKIGSWPYSWHDCGIVAGNSKEVIVCLMSKETSYSSFLNVSKYVGGFINSLF